MAKKYYWLKLKEDFFKNKRIKKLRSVAGGDTYTIIYLKMQLLSLKNDGKLFYEGVDDSFVDELALDLDEDIENVKITVSFLLKNGLLVEESDEEYTLTETVKCIGSDSDSKKRVAEHRQRKALREKIDLQYVQIISHEMIRTLTDNRTHFIDNKRYGGNAEYVYDLAMCKCENCGETNTNKFVIHHNNGYSNDLEDLYLLCPKCHRNVEAGNIKKLEHHRRNYKQNLLDYENQSVTCNTNVTQSNTECNIEIENKRIRDRDKEIDIDINNMNIIYNWDKNEKCNCLTRKNEKCTRRSTYKINGKNYCNQHSKGIIKTEQKTTKEKYFENEEVNNIFVEFLQLRKKLKAVNSDRAINLLINQLNKYDDDIKVKMIEQSILNSWKSVYELKESKKEKQQTLFERLDKWAEKE